MDAAVAVRFREGDPDAVRVVYRQYGRLVFTVALRALGDRDLAEEATQQTFVQAWRSAQSFDVARDLGPWLATIARRVAIDVHRRERRRSHDSLDDSTVRDPALLTQTQIAERTGIALGTVKSRTHRAHRRLAARLGHLRDDADDP